VKNAQFTFPEAHWAGISDAAKDFVKKMIVVNVDERLSMQQVLDHAWLAA